MLKNRDIRVGIEVFIKDPINPNSPEKRARVINIYPHPSTWMVVKYDDGNMEQVEERYVTTMYEKIKQGVEI